MVKDFFLGQSLEGVGGGVGFEHESETTHLQINALTTDL